MPSLGIGTFSRSLGGFVVRRGPSPLVLWDRHASRQGPPAAQSILWLKGEKKKKKSWNKKENCLSLKTKKKQLASVVEMFYKATARRKKKFFFFKLSQNAETGPKILIYRNMANLLQAVNIFFVSHVQAASMAALSLPQLFLFEIYAEWHFWTTKKVFGEDIVSVRGLCISGCEYHKEEVSTPGTRRKKDTHKTRKTETPLNKN